MHTWFEYKKFDEAARAAAEFIAEKINICLEEKNECHVALPGGNSPRLCLSWLAEMELPWHQVHWYLGDERCYPAGHEGRNDVMLEECLWSKIGETNIYRIPAELGAEQAAKQYRKIISNSEQLDIAFLGVGEDGHTASLFPDNEALSDDRSVVPVFNSPKPPAERVSLSIDTLQKTPTRIILTGIAAKARVIEQVKAGDALPVNCIGDIFWFIDHSN